MRRARLIAHWIDTVCTWVGESAAYLVLPLMAFIALEVVSRYVFNSPTIWVWDVSVQLQGAVIALVAGNTLRSNMFVIVDVVVGRFSPRTRAKADLATSILIFFGVGILAWQATGEAWHSVLTGEKYTSILSPPLYPLRIIVAFGVLLLFLQVVSKFIHNLAFLRGEEKEKC